MRPGKADVAPASADQGHSSGLVRSTSRHQLSSLSARNFSMCLFAALPCRGRPRGREWGASERRYTPVLARAVQRFSTYRIMRRRVAESGKRPRAAPMFSRMWSTLDVAGMAQVTAGWETMNLRKN